FSHAKRLRPFDSFLLHIECSHVNLSITQTEVLCQAHERVHNALMGFVLRPVWWTRVSSSVDVSGLSTRSASLSSATTGTFPRAYCLLAEHIKFHLLGGILKSQWMT